MDELLITEACTLPTAERPLRLAEFEALFASSGHSVTRDQDGTHIHLAGAPGLHERVTELAARESACCSFFSFMVEGRDDDLVLHVRVPAEHQTILDALADRAEELCG